MVFRKDVSENTPTDVHCSLPVQDCILNYKTKCILFCLTVMSFFSVQSEGFVFYIVVFEISTYCVFVLLFSLHVQIRKWC